MYAALAYGQSGCRLQAGSVSQIATESKRSRPAAAVPRSATDVLGFVLSCVGASGPLAAGRKSHRRLGIVEYVLPRALAEADPVTAVLAIRPDSTHVLAVLGRVRPCVRTVQCSETRPTGDTEGTTVLGAVLPQSLCHRPGRGPDRCGVRRPQTTPQTCPRRGMVRIVASRPGGQSRGLCSCLMLMSPPMPDAWRPPPNLPEPELTAP